MVAFGSLRRVEVLATRGRVLASLKTGGVSDQESSARTRSRVLASLNTRGRVLGVVEVQATWRVELVAA